MKSFKLFLVKNKSSKKLVILYLKKRINCHIYSTRTNFVLHLTHTIFLLIIAPLLHVKSTFSQGGFIKEANVLYLNVMRKNPQST